MTIQRVLYATQQKSIEYTRTKKPDLTTYNNNNNNASFKHAHTLEGAFGTRTRILLSFLQWLKNMQKRKLILPTVPCRRPKQKRTCGWSRAGRCCCFLDTLWASWHHQDDPACLATSSISFPQLARLFESVQIWLPFLCPWHLLLEDSRKVHSGLVMNILKLLGRLPGCDVELFCRPCRSRTREKGCWMLGSPVSSTVASCWTFSLLSRKPPTSASVMESKSDLAFTIFLIYHLLGVNFWYKVWQGSSIKPLERPATTWQPASASES